MKWNDASKLYCEILEKMANYFFFFFLVLSFVSSADQVCDTYHIVKGNFDSSSNFFNDVHSFILFWLFFVWKKMLSVPWSLTLFPLQVFRFFFSPFLFSSFIWFTRLLKSYLVVSLSDVKDLVVKRLWSRFWVGSGLLHVRSQIDNRERNNKPYHTTQSRD